jgi:hypothetical protein
VRFTLAPIWPS